MIVIVSIKKPTGGWHEVGMNARALFRGAQETHLRRRAEQYASGHAYRLQWFWDHKFYDEPFRVEEYNTDKPGAWMI